METQGENSLARQINRIGLQNLPKDLIAAEMQKAQQLIGMQVIYKSRSGIEYPAKITGIPENPWHQGTEFLTVSLEFRDKRNKLVRKNRILPECMSRLNMTWRREEGEGGVV